jgi:DNA polymerase-3 subunit delta
VVGGEDLLADRAAADLVSAVRAADPTSEVYDYGCSEIGQDRLVEITSPSLFGGTTVLVLRAAHELSAEAELTAPVLDLIDHPLDDVYVVLVHAGGNAGKAVLTAARSAGAVEVDVSSPKKARELREHRRSFVAGEIRRADATISREGIDALLEAVGQDLRELAAACSQLVTDTTGPIEADTVNRYYAGRAEVTSFQVADEAVAGRTTEALVLLRYTLGAGTDPVLVTGALARSLRALAIVGSSRSASASQVARDAKVPEWKVPELRRQVSGWTERGMALAIGAVAEADEQIKGAATMPAYALERVVVQIARARSAQ